MNSTIEVCPCACGSLSLRFGYTSIHVSKCALFQLLLTISERDRDLVHNALTLSLDNHFYMQNLAISHHKMLLKFGMSLIELNRNQLLEFILQCWKADPLLMQKVIAYSIDNDERLGMLA